MHFLEMQFNCKLLFIFLYVSHTRKIADGFTFIIYYFLSLLHPKIILTASIIISGCICYGVRPNVTKIFICVG